MEKVISGIPVEIERKNIRTLRLRVCPPDGRVFVSAPHHMPEQVIVDFVEAKTGWIRHHSERIRTEAPRNVCLLEDGDLLQLRGETVRLRVCCGEQSSFCMEGGVAILTAADVSTPEARRRVFDTWAREELSASIERLLPILEEKTGLHSTSWHIRDMKSRWGSCNVKTGRLCLNLQLIHYSEHCLQYVLLHELTHLRYPDHGAGFKAFLTRHMPDWQVCEHTLNPLRH